MKSVIELDEGYYCPYCGSAYGDDEVKEAKQALKEKEPGIVCCWYCGEESEYKGLMEVKNSTSVLNFLL